MPTRSLPASALLTVALLTAGPAAATLLRPLTVAELTRGSDVVIRGVVERVEVIRAASGMPVTRAEIQVLEVLSGSLPPARRIVVTQPGGEVDGVLLDYDGRPRFAAGEESVLFLQRRGPGRFIPHALAQGKFDLAPAGPGGGRAVSRSLRGAELASAPREALPADLDELRARVAAVPRSLGGGRP